MTVNNSKVIPLFMIGVGSAVSSCSLLFMVASIIKAAYYQNIEGNTIIFNYNIIFIFFKFMEKTFPTVLKNSPDFYDFNRSYGVSSSDIDFILLAIMVFVGFLFIKVGFYIINKPPYNGRILISVNPNNGNQGQSQPLKKNQPPKTYFSVVTQPLVATYPLILSQPLVPPQPPGIPNGSIIGKVEKFLENPATVLIFAPLLVAFISWLLGIN